MTPPIESPLLHPLEEGRLMRRRLTPRTPALSVLMTTTGHHMQMH